MILTVNYHYFRQKEDSKYPGIHGVSKERFSKQIANLADNFKFLNLDHIEESLKSPEIFCLITFDDGLKEQHEIAFPILKKYGAPGIFNINGYYIKSKKVSSVHKIHWIRSVTPEEVFLDSLIKKMDQMEIRYKEKLKKFTPKEGQNIYDSIEIKNTKYLLNHVMNDGDKKILLDELYNEISDDERAHSESLYMNDEMIKELSEHNFLGSHGWRHNPKTNLSSSELIKDFNLNQEYIKKITGKYTDFISYPYGGITAVSTKVAKSATKAFHKFGFTIERAISCDKDPRLLMPRFDANDIPHGKSPLLHFDKNKVISLEGNELLSEWFKI